MGILKDRVANAFKLHKEGKFNEFCRALVACGDVRWAGHRNIVDAEVENQLKAL